MDCRDILRRRVRVDAMRPSTPQTPTLEPTGETRDESPRQNRPAFAIARVVIPPGERGVQSALGQARQRAREPGSRHPRISRGDVPSVECGKGETLRESHETSRERKLDAFLFRRHLAPFMERLEEETLVNRRGKPTHHDELLRPRLGVMNACKPLLERLGDESTGKTNDSAADDQAIAAALLRHVLHQLRPLDERVRHRVAGHAVHASRYLPVEGAEFSRRLAPPVESAVQRLVRD